MLKKPKNVSELKSFLGLLNYYQRYFDIFKALLIHLRKEVKWQWQEREKNAFEKAKKILDETNFLIYYDPEKPLLLAYDASP